MSRYLLSFSIVGAAVPALWLVVYSAMRQAQGGDGSPLPPVWLENLFLMLCPPSLLFLGDPEESTFLLPALTIVVNGLLYSAVGGAIWHGLNRSLTTIVLLIVAVVAGWVWLLQL
ncbi:MAG: hypothetical protein BroJett010_25600 [Gammaproteobacteria bacterium]|nr:MAG: hypothetical protein BroJett010_25600 [Gammaproteobacteria bacterium]